MIADLLSARTYENGSHWYIFKVSVGYFWFAVIKDENGWTIRIEWGWSLTFKRASRKVDDVMSDE